MTGNAAVWRVLKDRRNISKLSLTRKQVKDIYKMRFSSALANQNAITVKLNAYI